jgi:hypothetical protein
VASEVNRRRRWLRLGIIAAVVVLLALIAYPLYVGATTTWEERVTSSVRDDVLEIRSVTNDSVRTVAATARADATPEDIAAEVWQLVTKQHAESVTVTFGDGQHLSVLFDGTRSTDYLEQVVGFLVEHPEQVAKIWLNGNQGDVTTVYESCAQQTSSGDSVAELQELLAASGLADAQIADECLD